jgi:hypothetical protein
MRWNGIEDAPSDNDPQEQQGQGRAEPKTSPRHSRNRTLARSEASIPRCPSLQLKRIEHEPNSDPAMVAIKSVNPEYQTYQRMAEEVHIVGRVVWTSRRL